jgi:hypothetical protein
LLEYPAGYSVHPYRYLIITGINYHNFVLFLATQLFNNVLRDKVAAAEDAARGQGEQLAVARQRQASLAQENAALKAEQARIIQAEVMNVVWRMPR